MEGNHYSYVLRHQLFSFLIPEAEDEKTKVRS